MKARGGGVEMGEQLVELEWKIEGPLTRSLAGHTALLGVHAERYFFFLKRVAFNPKWFCKCISDPQAKENCWS